MQGVVLGDRRPLDAFDSFASPPTSETPPGREADDYEVISVSTQWLVGRIFKEQVVDGRRWRSITSVFMEGMASSGYTDTLCGSPVQ